MIAFRQSRTQEVLCPYGPTRNVDIILVAQGTKGIQGLAATHVCLGFRTDLGIPFAKFWGIDRLGNRQVKTITSALVRMRCPFEHTSSQYCELTVGLELWQRNMRIEEVE